MGLLLYASQICQAYGTEADSQSCMQIAGYDWEMDLNFKKMELNNTFEFLQEENNFSSIRISSDSFRGKGMQIHMGISHPYM